MNDHIDWNDASAGIDTRNPSTGASDIILVADDGIYQYAPSLYIDEPPKTTKS